MLTIKQITDNTEGVIRGLEKKHFSISIFNVFPKRRGRVKRVTLLQSFHCNSRLTLMI